MQYGFYFNGRRCTGCKTCVLACKDLHDLPSSIAFRQVYEYGGGSWRRQPDGTVTQDTFCYYVSVACNHCGNPACVRVCPTGAMHKDERGLVSVDAAAASAAATARCRAPIARRRWIATPAAR